MRPVSVEVIFKPKPPGSQARLLRLFQVQETPWRRRLSRSVFSPSSCFVNPDGVMA